MKTVLKFLVLLFVPIFGLNSCSKDHAVDDWQMNEPVIEAPSQPPLSLSSASRRTLPGSSTISFAGSNFQTLSVKSRCVSAGQPFESEAVMAYHPSLSLKTLWPKKLWMTNSDIELARSECDFAFNATNANGSTHVFEFNHVKLASFASENFSAKLTSMSVDSSLASRETAVVEAAKLLIDDFGDRDEISLVCGSKATSMSIRAAARTPDVVQSLKNGLSLRGEQTCHFITYEKRDDDGPVRFSISSDVALKFASALLHLDVSYPVTMYEPAWGNGPAQQPLMVLTIANRTDTSTFVRIPTVLSASIRMLARPSAGSTWDGAHLGAIYESIQAQSAAVTTTSKGATGTPTDGATLYELGPNATLVLTTTLQSDVLQRCFALIPGQFQVVQSSYLGFRFAFHENFYVEQRDTRDDQQGTQIFSLPAQIDLSTPIIFTRFQNELGKQLPAQVSTQPASVPNTCLN